MAIGPVGRVWVGVESDPSAGERLIDLDLSRRFPLCSAEDNPFTSERRKHWMAEAFPPFPPWDFHVTLYLTDDGRWVLESNEESDRTSFRVISPAWAALWYQMWKGGRLPRELEPYQRVRLTRRHTLIFRPSLRKWDLYSILGTKRTLTTRVVWTWQPLWEDHGAEYQPPEPYLPTQALDQGSTSADQSLDRLSKIPGVKISYEWGWTMSVISREAPADRHELVASGHPVRLSLPAPSGNETAAMIGRSPEVPAELPDVVTLDQAATLVNKSTHTLRHYRHKGMPKPFARGRKGQSHEYLWSEMRPWLESTFNRRIPKVEIKKFRQER